MNTRLTFVLDASTPVLLLGLLQDGRMLGHQVETLDRKLSEWMVSKVIDFLAKYHYQLKDVTDVIVGDGPGSFTGVRLALTFVKTLGLMKPIQVYPISTLALVSVSPLSLAWLDARGGRRYVGVYRDQDCLLAPTVLDAAGIEALTKQYPRGVWVEGVAMLKQPVAILSRLLTIYPTLQPIQDIQLLNPRYLKEIQ